MQTLLEGHRSRPYNPSVANAFYRAGYIESWGRGIQKIKESCEKAGNPPPEYKVTKEDFMVIFRSLYDTIDQATDQAVVKTCEKGVDFNEIKTDQATDQVQDIQAEIVKLILDNAEISQSKIAERLDEKISTIKYYMKKMQRENILERKGSSQKGYWKVKK